MCSNFFLLSHFARIFVFQEDLVSYSKEPLELSCNSLKDDGTIALHESSAAVESGLKSFKLCYDISRRTKDRLTASKGPGRSKHVKRATPEGDATPLHPSKKFKGGNSANSLLRETHMKVLPNNFFLAYFRVERKVE